MDRTKKGIAAAAGFCLFLALILFVLSATVFNIAGDSALMGAEMRRHTSPKVTGLPDKQYPEMGEMITDYLMGRKDSFQYYFTDADGNMIVCFQAHEANHMADCRDLIQMTGRLRWYMAGAALLLIIAGLVLRKQRKWLWLRWWWLNPHLQIRWIRIRQEVPSSWMLHTLLSKRSFQISSFFS